MAKYKICIQVDAWAEIEVDAVSREEAIEKALKQRPVRDHVEIGEYVDVLYAREA